MDLLWLRYFVAVAEELSFTKAAMRFGIAQPPLSRHIQELEESLGADLFVRDRRHVELTDVGRALLPEAKVAIADFDHALEVARRASRGEVGTVRVAMASGLGETVERVLVEHRRHAPEVEIQNDDLQSKKQPGSLRERRIDVGFLRGPIAEHLNGIELFSERFHVLLPPGHNCQGIDSIKLEKIANEPILLQDPTMSHIHDKILELYANAGIQPGPIAYFAGSRLSQANQLRMKLEEFICFGTDTNLSFNKDRTPVLLDEPHATYPVCCAWRKDERSAVVLGFIDSVRRVFKGLAPLSKRRRAAPSARNGRNGNRQHVSQ